MSRALSTPDGEPRVVAPTTTITLARRMLAASRVAADALPRGMYGAPALDILLAAFIAEEDANYLVVSELTPPGTLSAAHTERWARALVSSGFAEMRGDLFALTDQGYTKMNSLIEAMFVAQRKLD